MDDTSGFVAMARTFDNPVEKALYVALMGHADQFDRQGQPYILHPIRVMLQGKTEDEQVVGLLHDVLEDTFFSLGDLIKSEFSMEIINAVYAISHIEKNQSNIDYYNQVKTSPLALQVKQYDINDNVSRLDTIEDTSTRVRLTEKYVFAWSYLFGENNEE